MHIQWKKTFETDNILIDAQHRLLVMLFRKLDVSIKTRESETTILRIVQEVKRYAKFHFISEENLMYETKYPQVERHVTMHTHLLVELNKKLSKLNLRQEYPEEILEFLSDWLINHISNHDQRLAEHVGIAADRPIAELCYPEYLSCNLCNGKVLL